jgi:hypothetical protein
MASKSGNGDPGRCLYPPEHENVVLGAKTARRWPYLRWF